MLADARRPHVRKAVVAAALTLALGAGLSGCALGTAAGTTAQRASGNGANTDLGSLQIRDITLVQGGAGAATLLGTIVNRGETDDALVSVTVKDPKANGALVGSAVTGGELPLAAISSTRVGFNAEDHVDFIGLDLTPTQYVEVDLSFKNAGTTTMKVMAVLPEGIYSDIAPLG